MSRRLQDQFWDVDLTSTEQLVAQRLAWHANDDDGRCWPGMRSLSEKTGLSERAIQKATKALEAAGHISREERHGLGMIYVVHPRTSCGGGRTPDNDNAQGGNRKAITPASGSPLTVAGDDGAPAADAPRTTCTPAPRSGTPARRAPKQVKNREDTNGGSAGDASERKRRITGQAGERIEIDWQPTIDLPEAVAKAVAGWPPGRLVEILDEFRDFWLAEPGARASKLDWNRTWHNRLRAVIARDRERGNRQHDRRRNSAGDDGPHNPMVAAAARAVAGGGG